MGTLFHLTSGMSKCRSVIVKLRLSSKGSLGKKALTDQTPYMFLTRDVRVTIIQDDGHWRFQTEVERNVAYRCSKFNLYCLLGCRDNSKLNLFLCWATVVKIIETTISMYPPHTVYLHAKFWMPIIIVNIFRNVTIKVQVTAFVKVETQWWPWVKVKVMGMAKTIVWPALTKGLTQCLLHGHSELWMPT